MTSLLSRLFGRSKRGSGATAKDRLRFVLQHDRINLPPERAEEMKKEILAVIVKYLAVDQERVEIALEQRDRLHSKLVAEIPIVNDGRHDRGLAAKAAPAPAKAEPNGQLKIENAEDSDNQDNDKEDSDKEPIASQSTSDDSAETSEKEPVSSQTKGDHSAEDKKS